MCNSDNSSLHILQKHMKATRVDTTNTLLLLQVSTKLLQWCRKVMKSGGGGGGGGGRDYVLLVVPYTSRGVWADCIFVL